MTHETAMWQVYDFAGHEVTIIQQWVDPFGVAMLRFGLVSDGDVQAAGMSEAEFLSQARLLREAGDEIVEGER